jgi:hypothetical protein
MLWSGSGPLTVDPSGASNSAAGTSSSSLDYIDKSTYPPNQVGNEGDWNYGDAEAQGFISSVKGVQDDMNSASELGMISIQSYMSQRETAVQLTTNLMQSIDDQAQKIAENIGH